jgi:hypothetical protein
MVPLPEFHPKANIIKIKTFPDQKHIFSLFFNANKDPDYHFKKNRIEHHLL